MSIRKEQCNKVCRILDDVLANRPTERDLLIVAVRNAFESLEQFGNSEPLPSAQPEIIRCKDCRFATLTYDGDCKYCQYLEGEFGLTDAVYFDGNDYCSHAERRTNE